MSLQIVCLSQNWKEKKKTDGSTKLEIRKKLNVISQNRLKLRDLKSNN